MFPLNYRLCECGRESNFSVVVLFFMDVLINVTPIKLILEVYAFNVPNSGKKEKQKYIIYIIYI